MKQSMKSMALLPFSTKIELFTTWLLSKPIDVKMQRVMRAIKPVKLFYHCQGHCESVQCRYHDQCMGQLCINNRCVPCSNSKDCREVKNPCLQTL